MELFGSTVTNLSLIIAEVKSLNPAAEIYVMGYYNALVNYLNAADPSGTTNFLFEQNMLIPANGFIALLGAIPGVTYVNLLGVVSADMLPGDIHPNKAGYKAIGEAIFDEIFP